MPQIESGEQNMDIVGLISNLREYFCSNHLAQKFFPEVIPPTPVVLMFSMGMSLRMADNVHRVKRHA
jgi:hypothetical protein